MTSGGAVLFQEPNDYVEAELTARGDQELTSKDKLTERYFSDAYSLEGVLNPTNLLTYQDYAQNNYYNSLIAETHTFGAHIVNNFIISYQLERDSRGPIANSVDVADLGVKISQPASGRSIRSSKRLLHHRWQSAGVLRPRQLHPDRRYALAAR